MIYKPVLQLFLALTVKSNIGSLVLGVCFLGSQKDSIYLQGICYMMCHAKSRVSEQ